MTRGEARRRKRRRQTMRLTAAWTVVIALELLAAGALTAGVAAAAIPLGTLIRGYRAFGGEYLLVALVFCGTYSAVHRWVCDWIFEEGRA